MTDGAHIRNDTTAAVLVHVGCDLCGGNNHEKILNKSGLCYVRCKDCGFIFTNPRPANTLIANDAGVSNLIEDYANKSNNPRKQAAYRKRIKQFESYRKFNRMLEVGSNVGGFIYQAKQSGWDVTGVEPVSNCAAYGREHFGLNILPTTLEEASLPDDHFDVVYSNAVIEHIANPSLVLQHITRVLRPGGIVYIDTVNYDSITRKRIGAGWKLLDPGPHVSLYTPRTLPHFLSKAGLQIKRIRTSGVRLRPNKSPRLHGWRRWREELHKMPLSILARVTNQGDSIEIWGIKPDKPG